MRNLEESVSTQLNPSLFTENNQLIPEVKSKLLEIVAAFLKYAQVDIKVIDVRLVGSNASYNYNDYSDLDLHIVTDLSQIADPETIARLYFDSIKKNFKDSYDIKIKGIPVEIYVEDINVTAVTNGIYSVSQDKWIKEPVVLEEPSDTVMSEVNGIERELYQDLMKANTLEELESLLDRIYLMRKDSLSKEGETGAGNLAFKSLRNKGIIDQIRDTLKDAESKELSLESNNI